MTISYETYEHMSNVVLFTLTMNFPERSEESIIQETTERMTQYCDLMGIDEVEDPSDEEETYYFFDDSVDEIGYNPYMGAYDYDC